MGTVTDVHFPDQPPPPSFQRPPTLTVWTSCAQVAVFRKFLQHIVELEPETNTNGFGIKKCIFLPSLEIGCSDNMLEI